MRKAQSAQQKRNEVSGVRTSSKKKARAIKNNTIHYGVKRGIGQVKKQWLWNWKEEQRGKNKWHKSSEVG